MGKNPTMLRQHLITPFLSSDDELLKPKCNNDKFLSYQILHFFHYFSRRAHTHTHTHTHTYIYIYIYIYIY